MNSLDSKALKNEKFRFQSIEKWIVQILKHGKMNSLDSTAWKNE